MAQELGKQLSAIEKKLDTIAQTVEQIDRRPPAASIDGGTAPLGEGTMPPGDIEKRLQKLEKKSETIVLAFRAGKDPLIVPENTMAKRNDKVSWQVVRDPTVDLKKVTIEFAEGTNYFPKDPKNIGEIDVEGGSSSIDGKVKGDHPAGIDKYTIRWQIGVNMHHVDPTIIVTDP